MLDADLLSPIFLFDKSIAIRYFDKMIESFGNKETEKIWNRDYSKKFPEFLQRTIYKKLLLIDVAKDVTDLKNPPGNRLHLLQGNRSGQYSIAVNDQWRICFEWKDGNAISVEVVDYH